MAISLVGAVQKANANNGGNATITWATTPSEGDYTVVVVGSPAVSGNIGTISTSGYTLLTSHAGAAAANPSLAIYYKKQTATPDTTVVGASNNSNQTDSSLIGFVLRGVDPDTFSDATPTTAGETTSTNPDPASITVGTTGACVIVAACMTVVMDTAVTAPSGYTGDSQVGSDDYDHTLAAAYKLDCSGTEAPASWTNWDSGLWYAITIAVKPASSNPQINVYDSPTVTEGVPPTVTVTSPDASTLTDNFDDNSIDTAKWTELEYSSATVEETSEKIVVTLAPSTSGSKGELRSVNDYSLIGSSVFVNVPTVSTTTSVVTALIFGDENLDVKLELFQSGGTLVASDNVNGTNGTIAWNASTMSWWRLREASGVTYWEYGSNGIDWTELAHVNNPISLTSRRIWLHVEEQSSQLSPGASHFDNLNIEQAGSVEISTPYDTANVSEDVVVLRNSHNINVYDSVTIAETVTVLRAEHNIDTFNSVTVAETVTTKASPYYIDVFSSVNISENITSKVPLVFIDVFSSATAAEDITIFTNSRNISVFDLVNVSEDITSQVPTQYLSVFDGVETSEDITIIETQFIVSVFDSATIDDSLPTLEVISSAPEYYDIDVFSSVDVSEDITVHIPTYYINTFDSVTATENITSKVPTVFIDVFNSATGQDVLTNIDRIEGVYQIELTDAEGDSATVTENITIIQANYVPSVFDSVTASENITIQQNLYNVNIFDSVTTAENISSQVPLVLVNVFDSVTATEDVTVLEAQFEINVYDSINVNEDVTTIGPSRYWVGGTGNWSDTNHWSYKSNGATGAVIPTSVNNVFIDANSGFGSGGTITLDGTDGFCNNFTCTSGHNFVLDGTLADLIIYGSATFEAGFSTTGNAWVDFVAATTGHTVTAGGASFDGRLWFYGTGLGSGGWTLQDDLNMEAELRVQNGTFSAGNHNITANNFYVFANTAYVPTIIMGSGTWEATGTGNVWYVSDAGGQVVTITPETSTIKFTDATATAKTFVGGSKTYNNLWLTGSGTGTFDITGSNTFNDFKCDTPPHTIRFTQGTTTTVTTFTVTGSVGNLITIDSIDGETQHILSKTEGTVNCDYLDISNSNATGGATWNAGTNSINRTNNSGWVFGTTNIDTYDTVNISENITIIENCLIISIFDNITVAEDVTTGTTPKEINVSDTITTSEDVTATSISPDVYDANVYDSVNISENITLIEANFLINVFSSVEVSENVTAGQPAAPLEIALNTEMWGVQIGSW